MYYALIMAGGSGTRLWPLSTKNTPKQTLRLLGERSMFQMAVDRLAPLFSPDRILVVTRAEHVEELQKQVPEILPENYIVEPEGRGTAPAIGLGAIHLRKRDPNAVMAVLTADHYINDTVGFRQVLAAAEKVAASKHLVTLGIQPSSPSTGYGYIQQGEPIGNQDGFPVFQVKCFTEKPDLETAAQMLLSGQYSWNSGMFIWNVEDILAEFQRQMPAFYDQLGQLDGVIGTAAYPATIDRIWPTVVKQTIDYGIMEGAQSVAVLPVNMGWSDVGSWGSVADLLPVDDNGNSILCPHVDIDTHNTLVFGSYRLIATIGVEDLIIIDTGKAVLVSTKSREQDVREVVETLKEDPLLRGWL